MILTMVIVRIISIISIIYIITVMTLTLYDHYNNYVCSCNYADYCLFCFVDWLESLGSRVVYELDYKKRILYVIPIQSILGKLLVVPVGRTTRNTFPGDPGNRRPGAGDGCMTWFVNSWALGWFRDM